MKKKEFQEICAGLKRGDILILQIRPHEFMPLKDKTLKPLAHCIFEGANDSFISISFEGTIDEAGNLSTGEKLPTRVNYARIEKIVKL